MFRAFLVIAAMICLTGCSSAIPKKPHVVGFDSVGSPSWWAYMNK